MPFLKIKIQRKAAAFLLSLFMLFLSLPLASSVLTSADLLKTKTCSSAEISPNGKWIAYTVSIPREASEEPGDPCSELYVISVETGDIRPSSPEKST
jgi:hypothetical protein